jgi:hypothetical protein
MNESMQSGLRISRRSALLSATVLCTPGAARAAAKTTQNLFHNARSTNRNVVHYDVALTGSGQLDRNEPLLAYWVMHEKGGRREGLTWLERQLAYGFSIVSEVRTEGFRLRLDAYPERELRVQRASSGRYRAELTVAGERAALTRIFVATDETGITPSVRYVDVEGVNVTTGRRVAERVRR